MPENTTQLKFHIRGPSFPRTSNLLQAAVDYDPSVSNYTIVLDAAAALAKIQKLMGMKIQQFMADITQYTI